MFSYHMNCINTSDAVIKCIMYSINMFDVFINIANVVINIINLIIKMVIIVFNIASGFDNVVIVIVYTVIDICDTN